MATCSVPGCKKTAKFDGLCTDHRVKTPVSSTATYTLALARAVGAVSPNTTFAALAASSTPAQPYKQRLEHLRASGPAKGRTELVHGVDCLHDTQKANNVTVWYSWSGNTITIWGLGSHSGGSGAGNDSYSMLWFDGTNKTWSRS